MAMVHWAPFREIESLQREMNQLFDTLVSDSDRPTGATFVPAAELHETQDAVYLNVELAGLEPKDLDIQAMAESVSISGERQAEKRSDEKGIFRSEFRYGRFQRVIPLPARVQNDKVEAEFKNGILSLKLPKVEAEKNKVVKVSLG